MTHSDTSNSDSDLVSYICVDDNQTVLEEETVLDTQDTLPIPVPDNSDLDSFSKMAQRLAIFSNIQRISKLSSIAFSLNPFKELIPGEKLFGYAPNMYLYYPYDQNFKPLATLMFLTTFRLLFKTPVISTYDDIPSFSLSIPLANIANITIKHSTDEPSRSHSKSDHMTSFSGMLISTKHCRHYHMAYPSTVITKPLEDSWFDSFVDKGVSSQFLSIPPFQALTKLWPPSIQSLLQYSSLFFSLSPPSLKKLKIRAPRLNFIDEFKRQGVPFSNEPKYGTWKITSINENLQLIPSYPRVLVVPSIITDHDLLDSVQFRALGRFPALCWYDSKTGACILRSSQPRPGLLLKRSKGDELLLRAFAKSAVHSSFLLKLHDTANSNSISPVSDPLLIAHNQLPDTSSSNGDDTPSKPISTTKKARNKVKISKWDSVSSWSTPNQLIIVDLRSKIAAIGNMAVGKGYELESHYQDISLHFLSIENIHAVRESWFKISALKRLGKLNISTVPRTKWYTHISQILTSALFVVDTVHSQQRSCLVRCSHGHDRTNQISSLSLLLLDPYFRTKNGFAILVQKEWVAFGHNFARRLAHGQPVLKGDSNSFSPIFIQWLDSVAQLTYQNPNSFQFSADWLANIAYNSTNCLFSSFSFDTPSDFDSFPNDLHSIWGFLCPQEAPSDSTFSSSIPLNDILTKTEDSSPLSIDPNSTKIWEEYWTQDLSSGSSLLPF